MRSGGSLIKAASALAAAFVLFTAAPVAADTAPPGQVLSNFESYWGAKLVRDCGYSEPVPGSASESVWVFCDTAIYNWAGEFAGFIPGSTAARGPRTAGMVPTGLSELPTPPAAVPAMPNINGPAIFLPQPTGLYRSDGTACSGSGVYPASWTTGVTRIPGTSRLLLTYIDVCVESQWAFVIGRMGSVEYTPSSNTLSNRTTLFAATSPGSQLSNRLWLGSPYFSGSYLYLFSSECDGMYLGACTGGDVFLARVPSSQRGTASAYRFRQGSSWVTNPALATSIVSGAAPTEISVDNFAAVGRSLVLVEGISIGGHYRVWEATSPVGPWTQRGGTRTADLCTTPPGVVDFCHALIAQPELSTTTHLAVTHYSVEQQHVRMTTSAW